MKLYTQRFSGHGYRIELLLSQLKQPYERIEIDLGRGEQFSPEFCTLNPWQQIPLLDDGGFIVHQSSAILIYLVRKFSAQSWYPLDLQRQARVDQWLSIGAGPLNYGVAAARAIYRFGVPGDLQHAQRIGESMLGTMERVIGETPFLAGAEPTIADLSIYSYVSVADEGGFDMTRYSSVGRWLARLERIPGIQPMRRSGRKLG